MTNVWLIGRFDSTAAASLPMHVVRVFPGASVRHFDSPDAAANSAVEPPDIVLVVQHRPREFSRSGVAELIASQPLASFVVGLGVWCASAMRSESIWPEAIAVSFEDVPRSLAREADLLTNRDAAPPWLTSGREEVFLLERGIALPAILPPMIVDSPDGAFANTLADLVVEIRKRPRLHSTTTEPVVVIWDADPIEVRVRQLRNRRSQYPSDRVVALTAMPTPPVIEELTRAGADIVVAKPFAFDAFYEALAAVAS